MNETSRKPDDTPGKPDPKPPKPDKVLRLVLKTTAGSDEANFKATERAVEILEKAIKRFRLAPDDPKRPYEMRRERDNLILARDALIGDLGLADGDVILIQPTQAIDG